MYVEDTFVSTAGSEHEAGRPAIAFVHGAGMDHTVWTPLARYFARHGYNVVNPDLPAHGRSRGAALTGVHDMAEWLVSLLGRLEQVRVDLVGHSMGSLVALDVAANHPERIRKLALLGTSVTMPVAPKLLAAAQEDRPEAIAMANTWSHSGALGGAENPGMWNLGVGARLIERARAGVFHADLAACNDFSNGGELAAAISVPTLIVVGANDLMTAPISALRVAELVEDASVRTLPGCGHSMMAERPNEVLDALAAHLLV